MDKTSRLRRPSDAACAPRLRPSRELKARPRRLRRAARRRASGRICAQARRAAGLADRLHRLGGRGGGAGRQGRDLRRRALHAAGAPADRHQPVRAARSGRRRTGGVDRGQCAEGREARLRPVAAHRGRGRRLEGAAAESGRGRSWPARPIRSMRCGAISRAAPTAKAVPHALALAGESAEVQAHAHRRRGRSARAPTRPCSPCRIRSAGCSTSAAPTCPTRRSRCRSRS